MTHNDINRSHQRYGGFIILIVLLAVFALIMVVNALFEPSAVRTTNADDQFDTNRAFARIQTILGDERPHPVDSPANNDVRDRLITQIKALGYTPQITPHDICRTNQRQDYIFCTHVENVSFRVGPAPGTGTKNTLLLAAHYDSVPAGPGAGDDMIGVASMLEVAYHLKNQSVDRPVLFLITDGEEFGLFGAKAFVEQDPRFAEVDTVLNFEARGVGGPAFMFETSQPNAAVISTFAKVAARPVSNSLMAGIYEAMPNGTDLTMFLDGGADGLNFAITRNERFYHTPRDNLANLSKRSMQHMGDQALALTTRMIAQPAAKAKTRLLYTDIMGQFMITLPQSTALPILLAGFLLAGFMGLQSPAPIGVLRRVSVFLLPGVAILGAAILSYGVQWLVRLVRGDAMYWIAHGWATQGFAVLAALLVVYCIAARMINVVGQTATLGGAWVWLTGLGLALTFALPGATIFIILPTVLFITAALVSLFSEKISLIIAGFAALLSVVLWASTIGALGGSLGFGISFAISALTAIATLPLMAYFRAQTMISLSTLVLSAGTLALAGLAIALPKYSANAPRHINISTYTDKITDKSAIAFITNEPGDPKPPTLGFDEGALSKGPILTGNDFDYWYLPAKKPDIEMPKITIEQGTIPDTGPKTTLSTNPITYRLTGSRGYADRTSLTLPADVKVTSITYGNHVQTLNGDSSNAITIRCHGHRCLTKGIEFTTPSTGTGEMTLYLDRYGLTDEAAKYASLRSDAMVPRQLGDKYTMLQRLTFPARQ